MQGGCPARAARPCRWVCVGQLMPHGPAHLPPALGSGTFLALALLRCRGDVGIQPILYCGSVCWLRVVHGHERPTLAFAFPLRVNSGLCGEPPRGGKKRVCVLLL